MRKHIKKLLIYNEFARNRYSYSPEHYSQHIEGYLECLYELGFISKLEWKRVYKKYLGEDIESVHINFDAYKVYETRFNIKR